MVQSSKVTHFIKSEFSGWTKWEKIILPVVLLVVTLASFIAKDALIATGAAFFGISYTILIGKGKISGYFWGILGVLCYSFLSWKNGLYGTVVLYMAYYLPMDIIGILSWKNHLKKENLEVEKTELSKKQQIILFGISSVGILILWKVLAMIGDNFPLLDSIATILSIAGMYLTVKRCVEQWLIWIIVNLSYLMVWVIVFANGGKTLATVMTYTIYFFLGFYFLYTWKKELNNQCSVTTQQF